MEKLKIIFLAFLTAITSFFSAKDNSSIPPVTPTVIPTVVSVLVVPSTLPTPLVKTTPKPTLNLKPASTVDITVLKTKFGITDQNLIDSILNDPVQLEKYEKEYYNLLKGWPEIKASAVEQRIYLPSLNSTKICKTSAINNIKKASLKVDEISSDFNQIKSKKSELLNLKTDKNHLIKSVYAQSCPSTDYDCQISELQRKITELEKEYNVAKENLSVLVNKYCR